MKETLEKQRELLLDRVLGARTLPQISAAKVALRRWLHDHPSEVGMADAFEQLSHCEDYALEQEAQKLGALAGRT